MNIYQLTSNWEMLQSMIENGEFTEEELQDTLESLEFDIEEKAENYGLVMKNLEALSDGLAKESKRLAERKLAIDKSILSMESNLLNAMLITGKTKFKTEHFAFSTRKSTRTNILVSVDELAQEYVKEKVSKSADKTAIKKAIQAGEEVYGAELEESISISIK